MAKKLMDPAKAKKKIEKKAKAEKSAAPKKVRKKHTFKSGKSPVGQKVKRTFKLPLTDERMLELFSEMSGIQHDIDILEQQKGGLSARIKEMEKRKDECLRMGTTGKEERELEACKVVDTKKGKVEYWFEGKVIETKEMTDDDLQQEFEMPELPPKVDASPADKPAALAVSGKPEEGQTTVSADIASVQDNMSADIRDVFREETGRKTKQSSVDAHA